MELHTIKAKLLAALECATEEFVAYSCAGIFLVTAIATYYLNYLNRGQIFFWVSLSILAYGTLSYLNQRFKVFWSSIIGKIIVTSMVFSGTAFSMSLSRVLINSALQVTSEPFVYTQSIVALLISPLVIAIIFVFSGFFVLPILMPFLFIEGSRYSLKSFVYFWQWSSQTPTAFLGFVRFISLVSMISICMFFLSNNGWYTAPIEKFAKWYAYNFETELYSYCAVSEDQKIAYLGANLAIAAIHENDDYLFRYINCD